MNDKGIEVLIDLWRAEECLWNVTSAAFCDLDARKAALERISSKMGGIDVGKCIYINHRFSLVCVIFRPQ